MRDCHLARAGLFRQLDLNGGALEVRGGQERLRLHPAEGCDPAVGNDFQARVEEGRDVVEICAGERDALLGLHELLLQGQKCRVALQVRISLGHRAKRRGAAGEIRPGDAWRSRGQLAAQRGECSLCAGLVRSQRGHCLDEARNEVMPAFELHIDQRPGLPHAVAQPDEAVEGHPHPAKRSQREVCRGQPRVLRTTPGDG